MRVSGGTSQVRHPHGKHDPCPLGICFQEGESHVGNERHIQNLGFEGVAKNLRGAEGCGFVHPSNVNRILGDAMALGAGHTPRSPVLGSVTRLTLNFSHDVLSNCPASSFCQGTYTCLPINREDAKW